MRFTNNIYLNMRFDEHSLLNISCNWVQLLKFAKISQFQLLQIVANSAYKRYNLSLPPSLSKMLSKSNKNPVPNGISSIWPKRLEYASTVNFYSRPNPFDSYLYLIMDWFHYDHESNQIQIGFIKNVLLLYFQVLVNSSSRKNVL